MDTLSGLSSTVNRTLAVEDTEYTFARAKVNDLAEAEQHIRNVRAARLHKTIDSATMSDEARAMAYVKLESEPIYTGTIIDDHEGRLMLLFLSLKRGGHAYTLDQVREDFPLLPPDELLDLMLWIIGIRRTKADPTTAGTVTSESSPKASIGN